MLLLTKITQTRSPGKQSVGGDRNPVRTCYLKEGQSVSVGIGGQRRKVGVQGSPEWNAHRQRLLRKDRRGVVLHEVIGVQVGHGIPRFLGRSEDPEELLTEALMNTLRRRVGAENSRDVDSQLLL